ncbi:uncharacterized protein [Rutidosis leptorrhynchoides]|uniref:uncharacterized protein n=1 Tax=Rutidosis leptorrhynchoides TaxID=125765 RepID=UPI003A9965B3
MTTHMGPPPPRNPTTTTADQSPATEPPPSKTLDDTLMPPPPPPLNPAISLTTQSDESLHPETDNSLQPNQPPLTFDDAPAAPADNSMPVEESNVSEKEIKQHKPPGNAVPYTIPPWSEPPCHNFFLEVLKDGSIIDQFDVYEKGAYMFGRVDLCDFVLEHPTISRFHAVLQFNKSGGAFIYDLSSTHGTFINKNQVKKKVYTDLHVGDVLRFGHSTRLYIFQGPSDLMPPEKDLKSIKSVKMREERRDMQASLQRAKREAALADGISWGMDEDAIEENEDDLDEITWQTFKGQLTEKQEKTREKVLKRLEKIANMKKEIDAIRAKDISQGGLTQGQQTQIARNEQRMAQVLEELENLEETLNESIRESLGARVGRRVHGKKKGANEDDEDEYMSDEDDFYDRTKKKPSKQKGANGQSVETADSLLDKKDALSKQIEEKKKSIDDEKNRLASAGDASSAEPGDELDAFMSGLSSQLVHDKTNSLQKELDELQSEMERVVYLLKIADPGGEASKKRASVSSNIPEPQNTKKPSVENEKKPKTVQKQGNTSDVLTQAEIKSETVVTNDTKSKAPVYTVTKPQWLGAVDIKGSKKPEKAVSLVVEESDGFVDYKDRKEVLKKKESGEVNLDVGLENAAPGLIIRKRKQVEEVDDDKGKVVNSDVDKSNVGLDIAAEDAVALLLKHTRGIQATDDDEVVTDDNKGKKGKKKAKKVLGPEKPSFLDGENDYESWVPPKGQSGDGRTSLNDRLGY